MRRALLLSTLLLAACAETPESTTPAGTAAPQAVLPSPDEAAKLITDAPEFADFQFTYASWSVPLKKEALNENTRRTVEELRSAGWLGFDGDGNVVLAERAQNDRRFLVRSNGTLDIVPLAKKELITVESVVAAPQGQAAATFTWKWVPNEVGAALKSGLIHQQLNTPHRATARFMRSGDGWMLLILEPAE